MDYFNKIKEQYPHLSDDHIEELEGQAKELLIHLLFPSSLFVSEEQEERAYKSHKYWILRCMKEMISRLGMESVLSYKENGLSITFDSTQISNSLRDEIVPITRFL